MILDSGCKDGHVRRKDNTKEQIQRKLRQNFDGKIVRKDLTKKIKEGANVPVYVLEFLLGQYCSSDDEDIIQSGVETVKRILSENYVRRMSLKRCFLNCVRQDL